MTSLLQMLLFWDFVELFDSVTPNIHMHAHLADCVLGIMDPCHHFGCFPLSDSMAFWGVNQQTIAQ